jgi:hypothetical protein
MLASFTSSANATPWTDDFNSGIDSGLWNIFQAGASDAPWNIQAPDTEGAVRVFKSADSDSSTGLNELDCGIQSKFTINGNFTISVDFELLDFPFAESAGWNEFFIRAVSVNSGDYFETLRGAGADNWSFAEGFSNLEPQLIGTVADSTMTGTLGITRNGSTMTAWIDRGSGPDILGSLTSDSFLGPMTVEIYAAQVPDSLDGRPHTALDVRFDNFTFIPEPTTLLLLGLGMVMLRKKNK